jgi:hypothetical protein
VLAWLAGAVTAMVVGVLALSLIGPGLGELTAQPIANPPVDAGDPAPSPTAMPTPSSVGSATGHAPVIRQRLLASAAGNVLAQCSGGQAYLISWSPAPGYRVAGVHRGPAGEAEVSFVTGELRVTMEVHCPAGIPQASIDRGEDSGHDT